MNIWKCKASVLGYGERGSLGSTSLDKKVQLLNFEHVKIETSFRCSSGEVKKEADMRGGKFCLDTHCGNGLSSILCGTPSHVTGGNEP